MTYFPIIKKREPQPEKCCGCGKWYVPTPGMENVSCCVMHGPGSCCHYSETEVPAPRKRRKPRRLPHGDPK